MTSSSRLDCDDGAVKERQGRNLRVLHVIPGEPKTSEMIFARRESRDLERVGIDTGVFYLRSRISPFTLWNEAIRYRRMIQEFRPDLVHAHFGTMTAFFTGYLTRKAMVVT